MLEEIVPLQPLHFFAFQIECPYAKGKKLDKSHRLPSLAGFQEEGTSFAEVFLGWHEKGLCGEVVVKGAFEQPDYPAFGAGDSIELFIDTRDVKTAGFPTRFCHHFFFFPVPVDYEGERIEAREVTRFRTDDRHELCDPTLLEVTSRKEKNRRVVQIFIPTECLQGYDPVLFNRLGFTYRINRTDGSKQYFSASDEDFSIESQPSLWASFHMKKEK